jgi:hypothetical protein
MTLLNFVKFRRQQIFTAFVQGMNSTLMSTSPYCTMLLLNMIMGSDHGKTNIKFWFMKLVIRKSKMTEFRLVTKRVSPLSPLLTLLLPLASMFMPVSSLSAHLLVPNQEL